MSARSSWSADCCIAVVNTATSCVRKRNEKLSPASAFKHALVEYIYWFLIIYIKLDRD